MKAVLSAVAITIDRKDHAGSPNRVLFDAGFCKGKLLDFELSIRENLARQWAEVVDASGGSLTRKSGQPTARYVTAGQ